MRKENLFRTSWLSILNFLDIHLPKLSSLGKVLAFLNLFKSERLVILVRLSLPARYFPGPVTATALKFVQNLGALEKLPTRLGRVVTKLLLCLVLSISFEFLRLFTLVRFLTSNSYVHILLKSDFFTRWKLFIWVRNLNNIFSVLFDLPFRRLWLFHGRGFIKLLYTLLSGSLLITFLDLLQTILWNRWIWIAAADDNIVLDNLLAV